MKQATKQRHAWLLVLLGGIIPLTLILGNQFNIPQRFIIPIVVVVALVFGAWALWMRANTNASGNEWWQDDSSSGWRGY